MIYSKKSREREAEGIRPLPADGMSHTLLFRRASRSCLERIHDLWSELSAEELFQLSGNLYRPLTLDALIQDQRRMRRKGESFYCLLGLPQRGPFLWRMGRFLKLPLYLEKLPIMGVLQIRQWEKARGRVMLACVYVPPELRHQGLGKELLRQAFCRCYRMGCQEVRLNVFHKNPAKHLYFALGFQTVGERMAVMPGGGEVKKLFMSRKIGKWDC